MPSKQVSDREKSTRAVMAAASSHADEIAGALSRELSPLLKKNEAMPDAALLAALIARKLKLGIDALVDADRAHEAELSDDAAPRNARDAAAEKVRLALVDLRDSITTAYGLPGLKPLGLVEAIPFDPSVLASRAQVVHRALLDASIKLPAPKRASLKIDRKGFAGELAEQLPVLQKALEHVAREEREAKTTLAAKTAALTAHDRIFGRTASLLAALASFGGLDEIAATVRPSARRSGRTAAEEVESDAMDAKPETSPAEPE